MTFYHSFHGVIGSSLSLSRAVGGRQAPLHFLAIFLSNMTVLRVVAAHRSVTWLAEDCSMRNTA